MAERKAKGTGKARTKPKRKSPAKRKPKATEEKGDTRSAEERKADAAAVIEDVTGEGPEPWAHLPDDLLDTPDSEKGGRRPLTAEEIAQRNSQIWRSWLRGLTYETLAETYGLKPRAVEKIVARWKAAGGQLETISAEDHIADHLLRVEAVVDELAAVAAKEKGPGRTSAVMARLRAMEHRVEFLQRSGLLPSDLGTIGIQLDLRGIGFLLIGALERRGLADPDLMIEIGDIISGKIQPGEAIDTTAKDTPQLEEAAA